MSAYDELVLAIRRDHPAIPLAKAEAAARAELRMPEAKTSCVGTISVDAPADDALEDAHVDAGKKLARALGGFVYSTVQKKRAKVTPGQPDILLFFPKHRLVLWWEAKKTGGVQSSAQKLFQELVEACGAQYVCGAFEKLEGWIIARAIARKEPDGTWTPLSFQPLIEDRP